MIKIISGRFKGRKLQDVPNLYVRPTQAVVRKSLMQILEPFNGASVLDLYAGTGSFGLECISRNAKKVTFVENYRDALDILKKNITSLKVDKKYEIFEEDCFDFFKLEKRFIKTKTTFGRMFK